MTASKNQLIVGFRHNVPRSKCMKIHKQMGTTIVDEIKEMNAYVVNVPIGQIKSCVSNYSSCKYVRYVEQNNTVKVDPITIKKQKQNKNTRATITAIPNDPFLNRQWGLSKVNASEAWGRARISSLFATIAILDTGIDQNHADLSRKIILNKNFSNSPTIDDRYGHGTHVAGIAAAITNNRTGVAGLSYNSARLMNIKVLGDSGFGTLSGVAKGIIFAANQGAHVINLSLGSSGTSSVLGEAVAYARNKGAVLVAAAGNSGTNQRSYPAAYRPVISVAATDRNDRKASFSNFGAAWVDLAAPGVAILSTLPNHPNVIGIENYGFLSGTSMSTPFVSALAALIKATYRILNNRQIASIIQRSTAKVPGYGKLYQFGRINAFRALILARKVTLRQRSRTQVTRSVCRALSPNNP
jgi:thermitase